MHVVLGEKQPVWAVFKELRIHGIGTSVLKPLQLLKWNELLVLFKINQ